MQNLTNAILIYRHLTIGFQRKATIGTWRLTCGPCCVLLYIAAGFITGGKRKKRYPAILRNAVSDYLSRSALTGQILGMYGTRCTLDRYDIEEKCAQTIRV